MGILPFGLRWFRQFRCRTLPAKAPSIQPLTRSYRPDSCAGGKPLSAIGQRKPTLTMFGTRCLLRMSLRIGAVLLLSVAAGAAEIPKPPGKLVAIGGYRLHLNCIGKGRPTVVLSPGGGDFSFDWYLVQKDVSRFARVCSYDRSGQAWSDPGPQPATMHQEAHDVRAALQAAHERGPYLLVGHSLGGVVMRVFANMYPDDTAGIVLVDATSPDTTLGMNGKLVHLRELAKPGPLPGVHTLSSGPPKLFSDAELKEAAEKRKGEGEPKIGSPYDRLPPAIQKLRVWALSLSPRAASGDDYMAEEFNDLYQQLASQPRPFG